MIRERFSSVEFWWALGALIVVYLLGFGIPLMENDAAQFAVMSMRIAQTNDYLHLFKGTEAYLDKPHLHYWLAALSFEIFGINDWAYRIPGLLFIALAAYSTFRLCILIADISVARIAVLFFIASQAVILMGHDMRTDAVLTGCTIFALWQLVAYFEKTNWLNLFLGALGLAAAFSTKGLLGVAICSFCLLGYIISTKAWRQLFQWKVWFVGLSVFVLASLPVFYAFYVQFGTDGILFMLIGQSVERMSGGTWDTANSEYLFFWHTMLWACLPYALLLYAYWINKSVQIRKEGVFSLNAVDGIAFLGLLGTLIIISFSKFKLPHYLNSMMPMFAMASAIYIAGLKSEHSKKISEYFQLFIFVIAIIASLLLSLWVFKSGGFFYGMIAILGSTFVIVYLYGKPKSFLSRVTILSVGAMVIANLILNGHFYPKLLKFQNGQIIAKYVDDNDIDPSIVYDLEPENWTLEFYTRMWKPHLSESQIRSKIENADNHFYIVVRKKIADSLLSNYENCQLIKRFDDFRVTRLSLAFLNPNTRAGKLDEVDLIRVSAKR